MNTTPIQRVLATLLAALIALACVNTTYSRKDEKRITNDTANLILGQFAHHGDAFYKSELTRTEKILAEKPENLDALNDKAVALLKLKRYDESEKLFLEIDKKFPNVYKVNSNMGVLYKKMERFEEAAVKIQKALTIKPGGHMGLGDYYLQMLKWRAENKKQLAANPDYVPEKNFLGVAYKDGEVATVNSKAVNKTYLITLVKNDMNFSDTYIVLGDLYFARKEMQMAVRCYFRAMNFEDLNQEVAYKRYRKVIKYWHQNKESGYVVDSKSLPQHLRQELESAEQWLKDFKELEASEIAAGNSATFASLLSKANAKPALIEVGYYEGTSSRNGGGAIIFTLAIMAVGALLIIVIGGKVVKYFLNKDPKTA